MARRGYRRVAALSVARLKLGRQYKYRCWVREHGLTLPQSLGELFAKLIPIDLLRMDHSSYSGIDEPSFDK